MNRFDILTLFPLQVESFLQQGLFRIASEKNLVKYHVHNIRDWATSKHNTVDDRPYGGGAGMVLMVEPIFRALKDIKMSNSKVILMTPRGVTFSQRVAEELCNEMISDGTQIIIVAGHYEGFDERVHEHLVDMEISVGDYVLSGGELPALAVIDAISRLVPGVLGNDMSAKDESFADSLLEYPQYTRPEIFNGWSVPDILLSGAHEKVAIWRSERSKQLTRSKRPDLVDQSKP